MKKNYFPVYSFLWIWIVSNVCANPYVFGQALTSTSLEVQSANQPAIIKAIGRQHIIYELRLTNWGKDSIAVTELSVYDQSVPQRELSSSTKEEVFRKSYAPNHLLGPDKKAEFSLAPGGSGILYQWLTVPSAYTPSDSLIHRFEIESAIDMDSLWVSIPLRVTLEPEQIQMPIGEGVWVTVRAPSNSSGHRKSFHVHEGERRAAERFAIDWVKLNEEGYLYKNEPGSNENWFSYNEPVRSVSSGKVVHVKDGLPDQQPLALAREPKSFTLDTVPGNTIVVEMGNGKYAIYAHLKNGSIKVEVGEEVQEGDIIGRIGNSGHSLAPHLHFHIEDRATPLTGRAIPFSIKAFDLIGKLDSLPRALRGAPWTPDSRRPQRLVENETPLENMVIRVFE